MTIREAAAKLGYSENYVYQLVERGRLRAEKRGGRWHVFESAVKSFEPRPVGRPFAEAEDWTECFLDDEI